MDELKAEGIRKHFLRGSRHVEALIDAEISLKCGELVFLVGASGSGKTTLLKILSGLLKADAGRLTYGGQDAGGFTEDAWSEFRRTELAYLPQQLGLLTALTAVQNVALPVMLHSRERRTAEVYGRASALFDKVGALSLKDAYPSELSGGETKRVLLARALMPGPKFLLADEPTADLDPKSAADFIELFSELRKNGCGVLVVTHEHAHLQRADRVLELKEGHVRAFEEARETLAQGYGKG
ncbi:ABC transporter ATP-binding protein [Stomatobaculum sp.]